MSGTALKSHLALVPSEPKPERPIAELEDEWRAGIGDAITRQLDLRAGTVEVYNCADCGAALYRKAAA